MIAKYEIHGMMGWGVGKMVAWGTTLESVLREGLCKRNIWADTGSMRRNQKWAERTVEVKAQKARTNLACMRSRKKYTYLCLSPKEHGEPH